MQKTPYELRISDWSSYVCSSDLLSLKGSPSRASLRPLRSSSSVCSTAGSRAIRSPCLRCCGRAIGGPWLSSVDPFLSRVMCAHGRQFVYLAARSRRSAFPFGRFTHVAGSWVKAPHLREEGPRDPCPKVV